MKLTEKNIKSLEQKIKTQVKTWKFSPEKGTSRNRDPSSEPRRSSGSTKPAWWVTQPPAKAWRSATERDTHSAPSCCKYWRPHSTPTTSRSRSRSSTSSRPQIARRRRTLQPARIGRRRHRPCTWSKIASFLHHWKRTAPSKCGAAWKARERGSGEFSRRRETAKTAAEGWETNLSSARENRRRGLTKMAAWERRS